MKKAIIGKKVGMTQIFDETGKVIPVTVIEAGPCTVVAKMSKEKEGYEAVQFGYEEVAEKKLSKPEQGHLKKAGVAPLKHLKEFRLEETNKYEVGDTVKADIFAEGDKVDVTGISKGHGYAGVIKRFGQGRTPTSHGLQHRSFPHFPGQEAGWPHGRGSGHRAEPGHRQGRRGAEPDRHPRRRSRPQGQHRLH